MSYEFIATRTIPNMGWHAITDYITGKVLARVGVPITSWGHEYTLGRSPPASGTTVDLPAIIENKYGNGSSIYFSGQLGRHYWRTGVPVYRKLIKNTLLYLADEPEIYIEAPETVHSSIFTQGDRVIVHLLNHTYNQRIMAMGIGRIKQPLPPYSSVEAVHPVREVIPVNNVKIKISKNIIESQVKVYSPLSNINYEYTMNSEWLIVPVNKVNEYEVVVIEPKK